MRLTLHGILLGMRRLIPVSLFVIPFGTAFGIAAIEAGLDPVQATLASAFVFTATAQFAALDFLTEPVAFVSLALVVLALSSRHIVMSAALSTWVNRLPKSKRFLVLATLSDANFADALPDLQGGQDDLGRLFGGGVMLWVTWVASTAVGAFGGNILGDTDAYGFSVVMICFFAATVAGQVQSRTRLLVPVLVAMGIAVLTLPVLPTGWNIILAALAGGAVSAWLHAE
ncbi:AzlC family ABC transporter permease [Roseibium sp. SCP14]|uniref:AzlC family ABC transporter permease n=1 Tax=Roseibium sp. SCP14 TaxID=3141375 RepID=UPI00333543CB